MTCNGYCRWYFLHFVIMMVFLKKSKVACFETSPRWCDLETARTQDLSFWQLYAIQLAMLQILFELYTQFFGNKDYFVGSIYYSTCKVDRANDEFDRTRRFETSHNWCHQERFQMFIITPIGATLTNFVVKRDLQNFGSTCGSLRKSFRRRDIKNTQPHLNENS